MIIYHAELTLGSAKLLPGGYLGVDIFFVISGFLITSLLLEEVRERGRISILSFYERRARRLLPALLVVMLVSLPFAWRYLLPEALLDFSWSLVSSLFFSSNFYWNYSLQLYGAESALLKPFLHTWSLAVEEQYYIVFPLLLVAIHRWMKDHWLTVLSLCLVASLLFAQWMTASDASFSFYMMPTRFWELLAGSLLACVALPRPAQGGALVLYRLAPTTGLLMILVSLSSFDYSVHHPGWITVIPVLGTVLIVGFSSRGEWVTALFSQRSMVAFGLISYALYLWHYPVFAFGRMVSLSPALWEKGAWIILTIALSVASYFLVEKPARSRRKMPVGRLLALLAIAVVAVLAVCATWIQGEGYPSRQKFLREHVNAARIRGVEQQERSCHSSNRARLFGLEETCIFEEFPGASFLVVVGDSHGNALAYSARELARHNRLNFIQVTQASCRHLDQGTGKGGCAKRSAALSSFLGRYPRSTIIYSARIPKYLEGVKFDNREGNREENYRPVDPGKVERQRPARTTALISTLTGWLEDGHRLALVYPVPEQGFDIPRRLFLHQPMLTDVSQLPTISTSYAVFKERVSSSYAALDQVSGEGLLRVYPEQLFCREASGRCVAAEGPRIYFASDNHVSPLGSDLLMRKAAAELGLQVPPTYRE